MRRPVATIMVFISAGAAAAELLSPEQQEVWAREDAYWKYIELRHVDGFIRSGKIPSVEGV